MFCNGFWCLFLWCCPHIITYVSLNDVLGLVFNLWVVFCNVFLRFCCQIITYVRLIAFLLSGASQPTSRPARWDELPFFCFLLFMVFKKLLYFTKHYTRNDLMLVFNFGICFEMVCPVFCWFCFQILMYVSLNACLGIVVSFWALFCNGLCAFAAKTLRM